TIRALNMVLPIRSREGGSLPTQKKEVKLLTNPLVITSLSRKGGQRSPLWISHYFEEFSHFIMSVPDNATNGVMCRAGR
ncbi:hypothetical protein ACLKQF_14585, partial [Aeromonas salmonicida]